MRRVLSGVSRSVAVLAVLVGAAGRAGAGPLNPLDFASLGAFPTTGGTYYFDTDGPNPTLGVVGGPSVTGVVSGGIAVFDFNAITVGAAQTFIGIGSMPVAFLSRGDATIDGTMNVSATANQTYSVPGPGGFGSASGPGAGSPGSSLIYINSFSDPGGGGFGGRGGNGGAGYSVGMPPVYYLSPSGGGQGGGSYGNLAASLQGGSGGGNYYLRGYTGYGGSGGGAIEIGAIGRISVGGSILANGSSGNGGGGSGGGIFLHGASVTLSSSGVLSAQGGNGYGGGGGRRRGRPGVHHGTYG
jgi:hypothetical protein